MISDFAGIGQGFRDRNLWLAALTGNAFPAWFYSGDALGSFNSWMRLLSGLAFGLGVTGLLLPMLDAVRWAPAARADAQNVLPDFVQHQPRA